MKKITWTLACAAALVCAASCHKEEAPAGGMVPATVSATISDTKVSLDGASPKWQSGDKIAVFTTDGTLCPAFTTSDGGSQSATFSGSKPDGSTLGAAVYPYDAAVSMSGSIITINVPARQDGSAATAVMASPADGSFSFSNLLCVLKLSIPSSLDVRKVEVLRDVPVCGSASLNAGNMSLTVPSGSNGSVSVSTESVLSGTIYVSILPSDASKKLDMVFTNGSGKMALISSSLSTGTSGGHIKDLGSVPTSLSFGDVALIGDGTSSQAYSSAAQPSKPQVKNGDFETWTLDGDNLPNYWNSFQTFENGGNWLTKGLLAQGYNSSNRQVKKSTDKRPGSTGSYSCSIWSRSIAGLATAQGNLTTGRVYASNTSAAGTGNYNYTDQDGSVTINGTSNPFHMDFTGRPDSMVVWIKFAPNGTDSNHPYAKVEAILHDKVDYKSGYNSSDCTGGTHKIAEATNMSITATNGWKRMALPFNYGYSTTPSFILINIATNSYPGGGNANDYMYIDDLEMVYNLYNVKTDATGWATLYLGYDAVIPSGVSVYYVNKTACGFASLVPVAAGSILPKCTGVLVKGSANTTYSFNGRAADLSGHSKATVSGNLLKGTLTDCSKPSGTCRVLSGQSTSSMAAFGAFSGSTIKANTAWLTE